MTYEPVLFTFEGEAFCPDCEPKEAPPDEVGAAFDSSDAAGCTCGACGAFYVTGLGWEPKEVAREVPWAICIRCNAQEAFSGDAPDACHSCGGGVEIQRP